MPFDQSDSDDLLTRRAFDVRQVGLALRSSFSRPMQRKMGLRARLLLNWPEIAGPKWAGRCQIERISLTSSKAKNQMGGVLVVSVMREFKSELDYRRHLLLRDVNCYLGREYFQTIRIIGRELGKPFG
ncbi:MAG: DciA family protein [Pseudomonadota bacterium]